MKVFTRTAWWVGLVLLLLVPVAKPATGSIHDRGFIQPLPGKVGESDGGKSPLQLELMEKQSQVVARITFAGEQRVLAAGEALQAPPGGMLILMLNDHVILRESFTGATLAIERIISFNTVPSGEHLLGCELHYSMGTIYQAEMNFILNAAPAVEIGMNQDRQQSSYPSVTFTFLDEGEEIAGFFEVTVDEHPVATVQVGAQENGQTRTLSEWLGSPLNTAALPQGIHLIKITARSLNGEETVKFVSFTIDHLPQLTPTVDDQGNIEVIKTSFHQAEESYSGTIDIYFQQSVILSLQSREPVLTVHRKDLINAFSRHNLPLPQEPVSLVICLRAANASENWQVVSFLP